MVFESSPLVTIALPVSWSSLSITPFPVLCVAIRNQQRHFQVWCKLKATKLPGRVSIGIGEENRYWGSHLFGDATDRYQYILLIKK